MTSSPHGQRHTCAQRRRPAHAGARSLWAKPVIRDNARPNKPTAFGGIAGRFAGRFVTSDQPRGIRAAASVPGRSGTAARAPIGRRAPIGPVLGARARGFRRTRRARIETQWPADGCEAAVSAAQQAGVNGRCAAGVVEAKRGACRIRQESCVQTRPQAGAEAIADCTCIPGAIRDGRDMRSERLVIIIGRRSPAARAARAPGVARGDTRNRRQQPSRLARAPCAVRRQFWRWVNAQRLRARAE